MPEILTRYPDVTKQVLESAGAKCGDGLPQRILTKCPKENFCSLPGGEACVYGVDAVDKMTQLSKQEICQNAGSSAEAAARQFASPDEWIGASFLFLAVGFALLKRTKG